MEPKEEIDSKRPRIDSADQFYFKSYESMDSHYTMLTDRVRTLAYKRAIEAMSEQLKGGIVVDVGSGTGILSAFCAKVGVKKVYGIEANSVAELSRKMLVENNLQDIVEIINNVSEKVDLPVIEVDAIVSEWMGYCLLCENMLSSVLGVRDRYLKKGGLMFPCKADLFVTGAQGEEDAEQKEVSLWQSLSADYGVNLNGSVYTSMQQSLVDNAVVSDLPSNYIVVSHARALSIDLYEADSSTVRNLEGQFRLDGLGDAAMTHLIFWFSTTFPDGSVLSTSPFDPPTHWMQTIVKMPRPLHITQKSVIKGSLKFKPAGHEKRSVCIDVELDHVKANVRADLLHFESFL